MTIGISIGRGIGKTAAALVHVSAKSATYAGQFGTDIAAGASSGYTESAAEYSARRAQQRAAIGKTATRPGSKKRVEIVTPATA